MRSIGLEEYRDELENQDVSDPGHRAFKCPSCGELQSSALLQKLAVPEDDIERGLGVECVLRLAGARGVDDQGNEIGCNFTARGLLKFHTVEVTDASGNIHPRFEAASQEEAQDLEEMVCKAKMRVEN